MAAGEARRGEGKREGEGGEFGQNVPEHDKDVRHMVHPAFVDVLQFFVGRGHKQQTRGHQKLP